MRFLTPLFLLFAASISLQAASMQAAIAHLEDRLNAQIILKSSRQHDDGVTLNGVRLIFEGALSDLEIQTVHLVGADHKSGDLLEADALLLEGVTLQEDAHNHAAIDSLFLEAADLGRFFLMLGSDWAGWQNMLVLSGVKKLEVKGAVLTSEGHTFSLKRFVLDETRYRDGRLDRARYRGEALRMPVTPLEGGGSAPLRDMGYEELVISWKDETRFEGVKNLSASSHTHIKVDDLGRFDLKLMLGNLPANFMQLFLKEELSDEESMAMMAMRLKALEIRYEDLGFLPRFYRMMAAQEVKMSADDFARQLADQLEPQLSQGERGPVLSDRQLADLKAFIRSPGTLHLEAAPKEGVTLMELTMLMAMSWPMLIERLELTLSAQPAKP